MSVYYVSLRQLCLMPNDPLSQTKITSTVNFCPNAEIGLLSPNIPTFLVILYACMHTVEPLNNGHIGSRNFIRCREVVRFRRF